MEVKNINKNLIMNEKIKEKEIRVNDDNGPLGIMSSKEALDIAEERELDLVMISPNANPPVCKIMDYGKHSFMNKPKKKKKLEKSKR